MKLSTRNTLRVVATLLAGSGIVIMRSVRAFSITFTSALGFAALIGGLVIVLYATLAGAVLGSCPACGTPIPENVELCPHCGKTI